ncbi:DUF1284 domain-containing protein [Paracoccus jeotgali]|uniref:DUF1284 domain-containing protein n=2 Tax=Paracoccus jeotgali TaxID=2065379 RepID=A0A2K9MGA8_9RHOB|nr:DUF1284 domain-containing protein [Paracoccus jeotgali]
MSRSTSAKPATDADTAPESGAVLLRPHHVLCSIGWAGRGYSPAFSRNMDRVVMGRLRRDPATPVQFVAGADSICAPCPHRRGQGCASAERIAGLDQAHGAALGIAPGAAMTWAQAEARARRLDPDDLDRICAACQWLPLGLCKSALAALKAAESENAAPDGTAS